MKRLRNIVIGFVGTILVVALILIWLLKVNGITEFDGEKHQAVQKRP